MGSPDQESSKGLSHEEEMKVLNLEGVSQERYEAEQRGEIEWSLWSRITVEGKPGEYSVEHVRDGVMIRDEKDKEDPIGGKFVPQEIFRRLALKGQIEEA